MLLMSGPKGTLVFIFNLLHQESDNHQTFFIAFQPSAFSRLIEYYSCLLTLSNT